MKFIGQDIYDRVARFRNKVFISGDLSVQDTLTYSSETLTIGADDNGLASFKRQAHSDEAGGRLIIRSGDGGGTNKAGGELALAGGKGTGNAIGGSIAFQSTAAGSSGSSVNSLVEIAAFDNVGNLQIDGNLTPAGIVLDSNTITGVDDSGEFTDDDAHVMTSAAVQDKIQAHYSYQYISLSANATTPADGDWMIASGNGIGNHLYNSDVGAGGTTASNTDGSASQITISKNVLSGGIMVPYDSILCGFYAQTRSNADKQQAIGIFTGQPIWNDYIDITGYLRGYSAQDISAGPDTSYSVRAVQHSVLDINYSLSAGEAIWFCLKDLSGSGGGCIASATIVLKTLIP